MLIKGYELDEFIDDTFQWNRKHLGGIENQRLKVENARLSQEKQNLQEALVNAEERVWLMRRNLDSVCSEQKGLKDLANTIKNVVPFVVSEYERIQEEKRKAEELAKEREDKKREEEERNRKIEEEHKKLEEQEKERKEAIRKKLEEEAKLLGKMRGMTAIVSKTNNINLNEPKCR